MNQKEKQVKINITMKVKLLKKFRKRFTLTQISGYPEMLDRDTNRVYSAPDCVYGKYSVKEQLYHKAMQLLTGNYYWRTERDNKRSSRQRQFHLNAIKQAKD